MALPWRTRTRPHSPKKGARALREKSTSCRCRTSVPAQAPSVEGLEFDRVSPRRQCAFASGIQYPLGLQVGQVEELLQLGGGEGPFQRPRVVGLNVTRLIELGDDLRKHRAK